MSDPNLQSFAVFANSNQAIVRSTSKSIVSIPFKGNLAVHDPQKMLRVALSMVKYTNSVYNIELDRNTLQFAVQFAPGRGFLATDPGMWQTWTVRVPPGAYDIVQLSNLLSEGRYTYDPQDRNAFYNRAGYEVNLQSFTYAPVPATPNTNPNYAGWGTSPGTPGQTTTANCFVGFGAMPSDETDPVQTKAALSIDNNSKLVFQSPDLAHMIQYKTDITSPCTNKLDPAGPAPYNVVSELTLDHSYVYKGVYLLFNTETAPLLKLLGFFNIESVPAPVIDGYRDNTNHVVPASGYGLTFTANTAFRQYPVIDPVTGQFAAVQANFDSLLDRYAIDNITYYVLNSQDLAGVTQVTPALPTTENFYGHFGNNTTLGERTPFFNMLLQPNSANTGYATVTSGYTISGPNILPPNPQILTQIPTVFRAICSRDVNEADNIRWNYDPIFPLESLLPTEIGIYGLFSDDIPPSGNPVPVQPTYIPLGLQEGMPITFNGNGINDPDFYLNNTNAANTNLFNYIISYMEWRLVSSGPSGAGADRKDWIFCIELTVAPQSTLATDLPPRMITDYADLNVLANLAMWAALPYGLNDAQNDDSMAYYNLFLKTLRLTVNNPQEVVTVDPSITYVPMLATNMGLNDLSSVLIPKNLTNLEGLDEIHVHCAQLRTKHLSSTSFQALAPGDVIAVVPVDVPFGSKGTWQPPVPLDSFVANTNIVALDFRLTDSSDRLLDFNGLDWSMVFKCEEVDVMQPAQMAGTINTAFQDQLATMEGTAHAQTRAGRKRAANMTPNEFYELERKKKMNEYGDKY